MTGLRGRCPPGTRRWGSKKATDFVQVLRPPRTPKTRLALGASALTEGPPFGDLGAEVPKSLG
eukprot:10676203-Alexandrium_andersonii.AAC.1